MHSYHDTIIQVDEAGDDSDGVEVPYDRLEPETLRNVISEFVTREWEEIGIYQYSLEEKIEQVMSQLKTGKAKLVFDQLSNSCNIVPTGK